MAGANGEEQSHKNHRTRQAGPKKKNKKKGGDNADNKNKNQNPKVY